MPDVTLVPGLDGLARDLADRREGPAHDYAAVSEGRAVGTLLMWANGGFPYVADIGMSVPGGGYGRATVEAVFRGLPDAASLSGHSTEAARGFWDAMGCRWTLDRDFELDRVAVMRDAP